MNTNVNFEAALGVLLFLGTCLVLLLLACFTAYGLIVRKYGHTRKGLCALLAVLGVYGGLMLLFSVNSREQVLARGQEKHFCEIDCHLAYSVVDLRQASIIGSPPNQATAAGIFYIVTVKTRFDENTISSHRGNGLLFPNPRQLTIKDSQGREYKSSEEAERVLEMSGGAGTPITTPLRPGEAYTTSLVFDLPAKVQSPTLLINEEWFPTRFIVGHENSFWHGQTRFRLDAPEAVGSASAQTANP